MKIELVAEDWKTTKTDLTALFAFKRRSAFKGLREVPARLRKLIERAEAEGDFGAEALEVFTIQSPPGIAAPRLVLVGLGEQDRFEPETLKNACGLLARSFNKKGVARLGLVLHQDLDPEEACDRMAQGLVTGGFEADAYVSANKRTRFIKQAAILAPRSRLEAGGPGLERGRIMAESVNFARELVNEPGNILTPAVLADHAQGWAREWGLDCRVLGPRELEALGMNSMLSVARGSCEPPRLIRLEYRHPKARRSKPVIGLVGKGVTFDSGGISIKPAAGMEQMKGDMAGAAAVIAAMGAVARLAPRLRVIGIAAAVENMPGGGAQRPGDVWTAMNGKTVEVINTDAEGRLILADALHYAIDQGADRLIDAATLTGAALVALGKLRAGLMGNDEPWLQRVEAAAAASADKLWRLPMDREYFEPLKSGIADMRNMGDRNAGTVTAAKFLEQFVGDTPWAHIDIAGVAWQDKPKPYLDGFATGAPVRLLTQLVLDADA